MSNILDGKEVAKKVKLELKEEVEKLKLEKTIIPKLAVIMVGNNPRSEERRVGKECM